jgi:hypothetical protein
MRKISGFNSSSPIHFLANCKSSSSSWNCSNSAFVQGCFQVRRFRAAFVQGSSPFSRDVFSMRRFREISSSSSPSSIISWMWSALDSASAFPWSTPALCSTSKSKLARVSNHLWIIPVGASMVRIHFKLSWSVLRRNLRNWR